MADHPGAPPAGGGGGGVPIGPAPNPAGETPASAAATTTMVIMPPSPAATRLFSDVRKGLEKSATVIWRNAVDSLTAAHKYYLYTPAPNSPEMTDIVANDLLTPRSFVEQYMAQIINILLDQNPKTTGLTERNCVEESLRCAVAICQLDLKERVEYWERVGYGGLQEALPPQKEDKKDKDKADGDDEKKKKEEEGDEKDGNEKKDKKGGEGDGKESGKDASSAEPQAQDGPVGPWQSYPSPILSILAAIFDRKKIYYRGPQQRWNSHQQGLPAVRVQNIRKFLELGGLPILTRYFEICAGMNGGAPPGPNGCIGTVSSPWTFPDSVHEMTCLLSAAVDAIPEWTPLKGDPKKQQQQQQQRATTSEGYVLPTAAEALTIRSCIAITRPMLHHLSFGVDDKWLKDQDHESLKEVRRHLTRIMDTIGPSRIVPPSPTAVAASSGSGGGSGSGSGSSGPGFVTTRADYIRFYSDLNGLIHRYLTSHSLLLRLLGWDELDSILDHANKMSPPPRRYVVSNAGCPYINGSYEFGAEIDADGWALVAGGGGTGYGGSSGELKYLHNVPAEALRKSSGGGTGASDTPMAAANGAAPEAAPVTDAAAQKDGKIITLFRCTMRSNQKWWFLSEADPDQPGTDKDIDYYQHKSKTQSEMNIPPSDGWVTCGNRNNDAPGKDPPPTLSPRGAMVPPGKEALTLAAQISAWAVQNNVIELVLGGAEGGGTHREVVSRSTVLIEFMAELGRKWEDDELEALDDAVAAAPDDGAQGSVDSNTNGATNMDVDRFSPATVPRVDAGGRDASGISSAARGSATLQPSHLSLAWKTYLSNSDEAVTEEVCKMLVSILPKLADKLAIHLLELVGESLDRREKAKNLTEVVAFCSSLVMKYPVVHTDDQKSKSKRALSDAVRSQVLLLLWSVLNHPDASSSSSQLRSQIENMKEYVRNELRYHPKSRMHFLEGCRQELERNATSAAAIDAPINEKIPLRTVNLTRFVLEACPATEAEELVAGGREALTGLLFRELAAYLKRYKQISTKAADTNIAKGEMIRKSSSISASGASVYSLKPSPVTFSTQHSSALTDRLNFLRYAYGLSSRVGLSPDELQRLWRLCGEGSDREALMVFLAGSESDQPAVGGGSGDAKDKEKSKEGKSGHAFSDELRQYAFLNLFCSASLDWSNLGLSAYTSFQLLLQSLGDSADDSKALDALWKICLTAGTEEVATKAMADLFSLYESDNKPSRGPGRSSFSDRVFEALVQVKDGLDAGQESSEREAERCLRILSAALKRRAAEPTQVASDPEPQPQPQPQPRPEPEPLASLSPVSSAFLSSAKTAHSVREVLAAAPHGLRSKSSKISVGAVAKSLSREEGKGDQRFALEIHPLETLADVCFKVASHCNYDFERVRPISITGGSGTGAGAGQAGKPSSLNKISSKTLVADLAVRPGCEIVFLLCKPGSVVHDSDDTMAFGGKGLLFDDDASFDGLFDTLFGVLEALPTVPKLQALSTSSVNSASEGRSGIAKASRDTHQLVWDILDFLPTNLNIANDVLRAAKGESRGGLPPWSTLLDRSRSSHKSIYIMEVIDSFLRPAVEILSILPKRDEAAAQMIEEAAAFRRGFIETGGFMSVMNLFTKSSGEGGMSGGGRRLRPESEKGNTVALRILKCCFMGSGGNSSNVDGGDNLDDIGIELMKGMQDCRPLLESLSSTIVLGQGMSDKAILDTIQLLRLLLRSSDSAVSEQFVMLPDDIAKQFIITLLLWDRGVATVTACAAADTASRIRRWTEDLLLSIPSLSRRALPWLMEALERIDCKSEATEEFFSAMQILVQGEQKTAVDNSDDPVDPIVHRPDLPQLRNLSSAVCRKIASHPKRQQVVDSAGGDVSTEVLGGCFSLLRALVESGGGAAIADGIQLLLDAYGATRWSQLTGREGRISRRNEALIDLMGAVFEGYLSPLNAATGPVPSSTDYDKSRRLGFDVVTAAAAACDNGDGYMVLVDRINRIISSTAPHLRYRWGHNVSSDDKTSHRGGNSGPSKFTGLKNQGCTCYMNSLLQQLFMMPGLRERLCSATLPAPLRSVGAGTITNGPELVGKKISVHWENNSSYDATVEAFNEATGMHIVRYARLPVQFGGRANISQEEVNRLPDEMVEEFFLHQGRPGKETGSFEIVGDKATTMETDGGAAGESSSEGDKAKASLAGQALVKSGIKETEDEAHSRKLFEEVQRTFVHLSEGLRGRCYDPFPLVEASACLKMEFEVWQQNDASEYAVKLLDKLEVPLKRWSPDHFKYLENTFGLKQTKQKVCKECGLKTNREEHFMNIDCQIRGKSDIHEALATMCEVEVMEGDNKVNCERCKKNTDTVLQTAISKLPNMLVLSLKRFDLDYNTFETVKINSRCSFDQTLNMKRYTLEAAEKLEQAEKGDVGGDGGADESDGAAMAVEGIRESPTTDTDAMANAEDDPLSSLPDEDYEYKLAGVLIHAGVAQGGHYYSFIRDRTGSQSKTTLGNGAATDCSDDKWYRFDDEDVTPFDPALIEQECFGGKVKKEQKFGNGQVHTVEQEQFANALMLFYEKVKPSDLPPPEDKDGQDSNAEKSTKEGEEVPMDVEKEEADDDAALKNVARTSGFDAFQPDVQSSNKTQCWLDFLLSNDFQHLLCGLIDSCLLFSQSGGGDGGSDIGTDTMDLSADEDGESYSRWHIALLRTVLSYVFNVLLHSPERSQLLSWEKKMVKVLRGNTDGAQLFVHELARGTNSVSTNWLRKYCLDCPEKDSREVAARIFHAGIQTCAKISQEKQALQGWSDAWYRIRQSFDEEVKNRERRGLRPMPSSLKGIEQFHFLEDTTKLEQGASSIGIIISFLNQLLEMVPLAWKHSGGMYCLLRDMACVPGERGALLRLALFNSHVANRLAVLVTRGQSHELPAFVYPACSMRYELASALTKPETAPTTHMMMGTTHRTSNQQAPTHDDICHLFEAIGCIACHPCMKMDPVLVERTLPGKTSPSLEFTEEAKTALATLYSDWARGPNGLLMFHNFRGILRWLDDFDDTTSNTEAVNVYKKSGVETGATAQDGRALLGITEEVFLAYFKNRARDAGSVRILADLHSHGFRPNLTRRSDESRYRPNSSDAEFENYESTGLDVMEIIQSTPEEFCAGAGHLDRLSQYTLQNYFLFFSAHQRTYHGMGEYLLDFVSVFSRATNVLWEALNIYYTKEPTWQHQDEDINVARKVFDLLVTLRDNKLVDRIDYIMRGGGHESDDFGLARAATELCRSSRNRDMCRRYLDTIKSLIEEHDIVQQWCRENNRLFAEIHHLLYPQAVRHHQRGYDHRDPNAHSDDSDMYTDDDDDPRLGGDSTMEGPDEEFATIAGAGLAETNGLYQRTKEICDGLPVYRMQGTWRGRPCNYCLFRCRMSNGERKWFISYVPQGVKPGTTKDVDFYSADPVGHFDFPPDHGWARSAEGLDPAPTLRRHGRDMADEELYGDAMDEEDNIQGTNI